MFEKIDLKARVFNAVFWLVLLCWLVWAGASFAFQTMPTTGDISVPDSATTDIVFPQYARHLYIKNDCATDVYIDLRGREAQSPYSTYPLRLKQDQAFEVEIETRTIGASAASGASGCTITVIPSR